MFMSFAPQLLESDQCVVLKRESMFNKDLDENYSLSPFLLKLISADQVKPELVLVVAGSRRLET